MICSFPKSAGSTVFQDLYRAGKIELELVPQGNLACRIQAAGAGLGAILLRLVMALKLPRVKRPEPLTVKTMCLNTHLKLILH